MSQSQWIKVSEFAKQQGLAYSSAHKLVTSGKIESKQLPTGTLLVRGAEIQAPAMAASAPQVAKKRRSAASLGLLLALPLLTFAVGIAGATGALNHNVVISSVTQTLFPSDNSALEKAARDGAVNAQVAVSEGGWQQLEKVYFRSTDSTYVKLQVEGSSDYTVTAVDRQSGDAYRYESATGRFVPTKGIYDVNSRSYR